MKRRAGWFLVAFFVLLLAWGVSSIHRLRVARGDVFPEYSTLRADPLGARALHDAAQRLPSRRVERWTRPVTRLEAGPGDLVFVMGIRRDLEKEAWDALDRAAIAGASVVLAWRAEASQPGDGRIAHELRADPWAEAKAKPEPEEDARQKKDAPADHEEGEGEPEVRDEPPPRFASEQERRWGHRLARRELVTRDEDADAVRAEEAPAGFPAELASWRSDLFFLARADAGWRALYRRGGDLVMMRRERGAGRLTLLADSFPLSNEAAQRERATALLADLLGDARRIVFVESHLGVETDVGVAVLARRYGLGGAGLMALVVAGLWFWRRASPLAPVPPEDAELRLTIAPTAGLEALLRRAVSPGKLHAACLEAWRATASASDRHRLESAPVPAEADPVAAHRAATRALSRKILS